MRRCGFEWALGGVALLLVSCGDGSGQTDGGGRGGSGAAGGASGHAGGTGGGSASCPTVSPCGGNIVGTWKVTQTCITETADLSNECTGGAGTSASANVALMFSGTVTYNADGTYTSALTGTDMGQEHYSSGCAPLGLTCAQIGQEVIDGGSVSCSTDTAGTCNCDSVVPLTSTNNTPGTYSTSGDTLTTTPGSMPSGASYCVQGSVLYIIPGAGDGGVTFTGDFVLTRQ